MALLAGVSAGAVDAPGQSRSIASLQEPAAVAVSRESLIYVCEAQAARVSVFDEAGALIRRWGSFGRGEAQFDGPRGIAVGADGLVYVSDTGNHRVQVFTATGEFVRAFGSFGADSEEFNEPHGLTVSAERVYVSDSLNDRVSVFDLHGVLQFYVWSYGYHDGAFDHPVDVALDDSGAFYVSDEGNSRVQKFDHAGRFVSTFSGHGLQGGLLASPSSIDHHNNRVYVTDPRSHRLVVFDTAGTFVGDWVVNSNATAAPPALTAPSAFATFPGSDEMVLCSALENRCLIISPARDLTPPSMSRSRPEVREGYSIGGRGNDVVIGSPETGAVMLLDLATDPPRWRALIGSPGHEPLEFVRPAGFDFDRSSATLLVSDSGNRRLQQLKLVPAANDPARFNPVATRFIKSLDLADPEALGIDPGRWTMTPETLEPGAMTRTPRGELLIIDVVSRRIVMLDRQWNLLRTWGAYGSSDGAFLKPVALTFDNTSNTVLVLDAAQRRVQRFALDGTPNGAWGARGTTPGAFISPTGIATASDGSVLVVDRKTSRVQRFGAQGQLHNAWGQPGNARSEFMNPEGIYIDARDRVLVLDSGNRRLQAFTLAGQYLWQLPLDPRASVTP